MEPNPSAAQPAEPVSDRGLAARELVEEIASGVDTVFFQPVVEQAVAGVRFAFLAMILVPIGIVGLAASFLLLGGLLVLLGTPSGALGTILMLGWLAGTLVVMVLGFRAIYRRLPRALRDSSVSEAARPAQWLAGGPLARLVGGRPVDPPAPAAAPTRPAPTLAELDARFAPTAALEPKEPPG